MNKLTTTTSSAIITALKAVFSRHGLPEVVRSDNGPQYSSHEFARFADSYNFKHVTSSPLYPQSNGQAERAVQTVKNILKQSQDPFMGLLSYRSTPTPWCGLSPAELCMGRRIRTSVPQVTTQHEISSPTFEGTTRSSRANRRKTTTVDMEFVSALVFLTTQRFGSSQNRSHFLVPLQPQPVHHARMRSPRKPDC